jgi:hypothetical protein
VAEATLLTDNGSDWDIILLKLHFDDKKFVVPHTSRCAELGGQRPEGAIAKTVMRRLHAGTPGDIREVGWLFGMFLLFYSGDPNNQIFGYSGDPNNQITK